MRITAVAPSPTTTSVNAERDGRANGAASPIVTGLGSRSLPIRPSTIGRPPDPGGFLLRPDPVPGSAREGLHPAATTDTLFH